MKVLILYTFGYLVFFYSMALMFSYACMMVLAYWEMRRHLSSRHDLKGRKLLDNSPYTPGVSIIASAYNEERVIVDCVESFLRQDYPRFEVVIVNDGSTDETLQLMVDHFALEEVPYHYIERIRTKPYRRLFKSMKNEYARLTVVDKENGGTKADSINAGLNVAQYPYFINTDADCILSLDAAYYCMRPILENFDVIAVSGAMAMNNGCKIERGNIERCRVPHTPSPLFQAVEYLRSFMLGKMAWSRINAMPNVSGGYGLFDTHVAIAAGGYSADSFAEDMDMLIRMIGYCCDFDKPYRVVQIPETCCWTQGPPGIVTLYKQRVRWGRGLIQTFYTHYRMMFRPKYRHLGMITMPYIFVFEFTAPLIELMGWLVFIYLAFTGGVNWQTAGIIALCVFVFSFLVAIVAFTYDFMQGVTYGKKRSFVWLVLAAFFEPFLYHPLIVLFSLKGYFNFIVGIRRNWGKMTRKKYNENADGVGENTK